MRFLSVLVCVLSGCTVLAYESDGFCCKAELAAGTKVTVDARVSPASDSLFRAGYPRLTAEFVVPAAEGRNLQLVQADLVDAGTPDSVVVEAGYFDVYTSDRFVHPVPVQECCAGLADRIPHNVSPGQEIYGPVYFGIRIAKTYRSALLPEHVTLSLAVRTLSGSAQNRRDLTLVRRKSEGVPFRFH